MEGTIRYELSQPWTGGKGPAVISKQEFDGLLEAKIALIQMLAFEEKMDMVLESLLEHERDFLELALRSAVFQEFDWSALRERTQLVNRRLLNLLSACQLYLDQVPQDLAALGDPTLKKVFAGEVDKERQTRFAFRFMEAIRNYLQHRDVPIAGLLYDGAWVGGSGQQWRRHLVRPNVSVERLIQKLRADRKFDKVVLKEIETKGKSIDLKVCVREYVSSLGAIHARLRDHLEPRVTAWDSKVLDSLQRYQSKTQASLPVRLVARSLASQGVETESLQLFSDFIDRRVALVWKNRYTQNLDKFLITSE